MGFSNVGHIVTGMNGWVEAGGAIEEVSST